VSHSPSWLIGMRRTAFFLFPPTEFPGVMRLASGRRLMNGGRNDADNPSRMQEIWRMSATYQREHTSAWGAGGRAEGTSVLLVALHAVSLVSNVVC